MAFTTEFVMGAGGSVEVEEIPVSMSGGGSGNVYPLTTVDAGAGAWIVITGTMTPGTTNATYRPLLVVGSATLNGAHDVIDGPNMGAAAYVSGTVNIYVQTRWSTSATLNGTVHVIRV